MFTFVLPRFKLVVTFVPGKPFSIMRLIYLSLFICNDQREADSLIRCGLNAHKWRNVVERSIVGGGGVGVEMEAGGIYYSCPPSNHTISPTRWQNFLPRYAANTHSVHQSFLNSQRMKELTQWGGDGQLIPMFKFDCTLQK